MRVMGKLVLACIVTGYVSVSAAQRSSPTAAPACRAADVAVVTATPTLKAGTSPQFSVVVTNKSRDPIRVLDVRNGRRVDLQHNYFELFIVEGPRLVDLPIAISDPGPVADADYTVLKPGERMDSPLTELHQGGGGATARQVLGVHSVLARPIHAAYIAVPFERSAVCGLELSPQPRCPPAVSVAPALRTQ
jgi:hypothetical protein